jgi:hypothetical protein
MPTVAAVLAAILDLRKSRLVNFIICLLYLILDRVFPDGCSVLLHERFSGALTAGLPDQNNT